MGGVAPRRRGQQEERRNSSGGRNPPNRAGYRPPSSFRPRRRQGKGALMIDTLTVVGHSGGSGNPMYYMTEQALEKFLSA